MYESTKFFGVSILYLLIKYLISELSFKMI